MEVGFGVVFVDELEGVVEEFVCYCSKDVTFLSSVKEVFGTYVDVAFRMVRRTWKFKKIM